MVVFALLLKLKTLQVVDALKLKTIDRYKCFLNKIKKGYKPDYQEILDLICFINLPITIDNSDFIKQQLLNKNDTLYLHFSN